MRFRGRVAEWFKREATMLPGAASQAKRVLKADGRVAEWFKALVLKTIDGASRPWVRIPPLPPKRTFSLVS